MSHNRCENDADGRADTASVGLRERRQLPEEPDLHHASDDHHEAVALVVVPVASRESRHYEVIGLHGLHCGRGLGAVGHGVQKKKGMRNVLKQGHARRDPQRRCRFHRELAAPGGSVGGSVAFQESRSWMRSNHACRLVKDLRGSFAGAESMRGAAIARSAIDKVDPSRKFFDWRWASITLPRGSSASSWRFTCTASGSPMRRRLLSMFSKTRAPMVGLQCPAPQNSHRFTSARGRTSRGYNASPWLASARYIMMALDSERRKPRSSRNGTRPMGFNLR